MITRDENTFTGTSDDDEILLDLIYDEDNTLYPYVVVHGMGGNDTIETVGEFYSQTLSIYGGEGNDIINGGSTGIFISGDEGDDTIVGGASAGNNTVFGGAGNDTITSRGKGVVYGDEGDDTFVINGGTKLTVYGGDGADTVVMGGDRPLSLMEGVEELAVRGSLDVGEETLQSITHISAYSTKGVRLHFTDAVNVTSAFFDENMSGTISGSKFDDILDFSASAHLLDLDGGNGNDILKGSSADNSLSGSNGDDTILGGAGDDTIEFGRGNDTAWGGAGNDRFGYTNYNDPGIKAYGGTGDDVFFLSTLGTGAEIVGGSGRDTMYFGGSIAADARIDVDLLLVEDVIVAAPETLNDIKEIAERWGRQLTITLSQGGVFKPQRIEDGGWELNGSRQDDVVDLSASHAKRGWSNVILGKGDDTFKGTDHKDSVVGGPGDDRLSAGGGNDVCFGLEGNDILVDGAGNDRLSGGNGVDTFVFHGDVGHDRIQSFKAYGMVADIIDLSAVNAIQNFKDLIDNHVTMSGNGFWLVIELGKDSDIVVGTLKPGDLQESNFLF